MLRLSINPLDNGRRTSTSSDTIVCPCPSWNVIEKSSAVNSPSVNNVPNIVTVLFDATHFVNYENDEKNKILDKIVILNSTSINNIVKPKLITSLAKDTRLNTNNIHIRTESTDSSTIKETEVISSTASDVLYNSIGSIKTSINITLEFDYDHEITLPVQLMMNEISFKSYIISILRSALELNDKQIIRSSMYYNDNVGNDNVGNDNVDNIYPKVQWTFKEWHPPLPEKCFYETDDFIIMMFNEIWCWYRDLPLLTHMIVLSSVSGFVLILLIILFSTNYANHQRLCCDTCRCCTNMGRLCCYCLPCCSCCRCCRCCIKTLDHDENDEEGDSFYTWCDCSGCKNNCKGDDNDDYQSVMPNILGVTAKPTKSVKRQLSKIVPIKTRPVGAPVHVIAEMFSFEDVSYLF